MAPKSIVFVFLMLLICAVIYADADRDNFGKNRRKRFATKLKIVTLENKPYLSRDQGENGIDFNGFIPDLIHEMSKRLNFDYEFYTSPDGKYGAEQENGEWNGMMGELIKRETSNEGADMAAAPLTLTAKREEVVDFVKPFHHLGLTLLVQKAYMEDNSTVIWPLDFSIFRPLSAYVWLVIFITIIVVGVLLGLLNRFNPYEWGARYNRGQALEHEKDSFSWSSSLWFVFTTLQWQGFERAPRSIAAKCLACFWFFFVTLTLVTYVGALVNHLWWASMVQRHNPTKHHIQGLEDIVAGDFQDFKVGCIGGGSTYKYVTEVAAPKKVEFGLVKNYWQTDDGAKQIVSTTADGVAKVRSEKFAFIMETMSARYLMNQKPCDLTTVGQQFGLRSYGLAVPKNSTYLEDFHKVILELTEEGEIDSLEQKWWEGKGECWNVTSMEKTLDKATAMYVNQSKPKVVDLEMYWGVIVTMVLGIIISALIAAAEILYYRYRGRHDEVNRSQIQSLPKMENEDGYGR